MQPFWHGAGDGSHESPSVVPCTPDHSQSLSGSRGLAPCFSRRVELMIKAATIIYTAVISVPYRLYKISDELGVSKEERVAARPDHIQQQQQMDDTMQAVPDRHTSYCKLHPCAPQPPSR